MCLYLNIMTGHCGVKTDVIQRATSVAGKHPFVVAVLLVDTNNKTTRCAGSIIKPTYILTAATCLLKAGLVFRHRFFLKIYKHSFKQFYSKINF